MYYLGVTGTQEGLTPAQMVRVETLLSDLRSVEFSVMHNGKCIGADYSLACIWDKLGGKLWWHPPTITTKMVNLILTGENSDSPLPYLDRNRVIVDRSRVLIACPKEFKEQLRSGTWATIRYARKSKKAHVIVWPDGTVQKESYNV